MVIKKEDKYPLVLLLIFVVVFIITAINPFDKLAWFLDGFPTLIGILILIFTYKRFRFTNLTYTFICVYIIVMLIGSHYSFPRVPLFNWLRDIFNLSRNHYDRFAHFLLGFVPALIIREIAIKKDILVKNKFLAGFIIVCICLALGAFYEILEGIVGINYGTSADYFLGAQGDMWDTQWDLLMDLIGAISSVVILGPKLDKLLGKKERKAK